MGKEEICIVIPVYKETLNVFEIKSVKQCIKILSDYSIYFIYPDGLNLDFYKTKFPEIEHFMHFNKSYFKDISGYNTLMLSLNFYRKFNDYDYMLIYQTDCFVFRDELLDWSSKGYDYIGGVWFEGCNENPYLGAKLSEAGNGGFSLRNIKSIIKLLNSKKPVKSIKQLIFEKKKLFKKEKINCVKELIVLPLNLLGYKNNYRYYASKNNNNEDKYFVKMFSKCNPSKLPVIDDSLLFSWDTYPDFLYEKLGALPFGCHAWYRNDELYKGNKFFWLNHITEVSLK